MGVGVYKLLSQMDIYADGGSNALTSVVTGFFKREKKTEVVACRKRKQV